MRTEFKGSSITIETTQKNGGPWAAVVQVRPVDNKVSALRDQRELEGYKNQGEAEDAGLQWARERIDAFAENRRLMEH